MISHADTQLVVILSALYGHLTWECSTNVSQQKHTIFSPFSSQGNAVGFSVKLDLNFSGRLEECADEKTTLEEDALE